MSGMAAQLQAGLTLHQQGRLAEAAAIYRQILASDPDHSGALHWMGVVAYQTGRPDEAMALISRALAAEPDSALAHFNLGNVFFLLERLEEALASYETAITLRPDHADSHNSRGNVLSNLQRFDEALDSFARAIALRPHYAEAYSNRSVTLYDLGRLEEAVADCDRAIALRPDFADAHYNRGLSLKALRRFADALASYDRALAFRPDFADAHHNRGIVLSELHRFQEAVRSCDRAIAQSPAFADAHLQRAAALGDLRRFEDALVGCDTAIALRPDFAEAHVNRGVNLHELGRFEEARVSLDRAVALEPDGAGGRHNRALLNLLLGRYEEGWQEYEYRLAMPGLPPGPGFRQPRLSSLRDISGKTVLVHSEQGLGDTIQFCRYVGLLRDAGANVLFAPQPQLRALLSSGMLDVAFVARDDPSLAFDCHVPLMSLPLLFSTVAATVPAQNPYLFATDDRMEKWRQRIGGEGFRVGICWRGNSYRHDYGRSFSVAQFRGLSRLPGVTLFSLQKGSGEKELAALSDAMAVTAPGDDFDAGPDAFLDTAAAMMCLDLVVTADTSVAHVAGALGVRTWLALPHIPDWRWLLERSDTPWYPTLRLFRQPARGDWASVFNRMEAELAAELGQGL